MERIVPRVRYDENNVYFSVHAYDSDADQVIVRSMARSGGKVQFVIDPGQTRRNAYVFIMGPSGGRWDGLCLNNLEELRE